MQHRSRKQMNGIPEREISSLGSAKGALISRIFTEEFTARARFTRRQPIRVERHARVRKSCGSLSRGLGPAGGNHTTTERQLFVVVVAVRHLGSFLWLKSKTESKHLDDKPARTLLAFGEYSRFRRQTDLILRISTLRRLLCSISAVRRLLPYSKHLTLSTTSKIASIFLKRGECEHFYYRRRGYNSRSACPLQLY